MLCFICKCMDHVLYAIHCTERDHECDGFIGFITTIFLQIMSDLDIFRVFLIHRKSRLTHVYVVSHVACPTHSFYTLLCLLLYVRTFEPSHVTQNKMFKTYVYYVLCEKRQQDRETHTTNTTTSNLPSTRIYLV